MIDSMDRKGVSVKTRELVRVTRLLVTSWSENLMLDGEAMKEKRKEKKRGGGGALSILS